MGRPTIDWMDCKELYEVRDTLGRSALDVARQKGCTWTKGVKASQVGPCVRIPRSFTTKDGREVSFDRKYGVCPPTPPSKKQLAARERFKLAAKGQCGPELKLCGSPADRARGEVITPQGSDRITYRAMSAQDIIASHDPMSFTPDSRYPANVQERDYLHDKSEQVKVVRGSEKLNPSILLHRAPTPIDGPPLVTRDGCALGGNGRSLMLKRAYQADGAAAKRYREQLLCHAAAFGLTPSEINAIPDPVLVRVVDEYSCESDPKDLAKAVRRYNVALTNSLDDQALAVSQSRQLNPNTIAQFGELLSGDASLRDRMREDPRAFARLLENDGIVTQQNRAEWIASGGALTEQAKDRIEGLFLGRALGNIDRIRSTSPGLLRKVERAVPYLTQVASRNPAYDQTVTLQKALDLVNDASARGVNLEDVLSQQSLFGGEQISPAVKGLARVLANESATNIRERFKNYAQAAAFDPRQAGLLQKPPTLPEAIAALTSGRPSKTGRPLFTGTVVNQGGDMARVIERGGSTVRIEYISGPKRGKKETLSPENVGDVVG